MDFATNFTIKASLENLIPTVRRGFTKIQNSDVCTWMFWHGHEGCKYYVVPKTRIEWWLNKINGNIANDKKATKALKKKGWKIINLWSRDFRPLNFKAP